MMKCKQLLVSLMAMFCFFSNSYAQYQPNWESVDKRRVPEWYQDAKFGIFIHWGVYSVPAYAPVGSYSEWYQHSLRSDPDGATALYHKKKFGDLTYYQLADRFKAELFNPDEWAQLFEKSGAKYVVLTSKHHDGFTLWPSKEADRDWGFPWTATEVGPKQDLIKELFTALRKTDVRPGLYYSLYEWYNPLYLKNPREFVIRHTIPQMKDLINNYKPYILWTDGGWEQSDSTWHAPQFLSWLYNDSPMKDSIVTYDRWGSGVRFHHGGVYTPEYQPGLTFNNHYFEESQGMGYSYGYNRAENAWDYSSARLLILQLADIVSRGGNFLLDIGPSADGKIPPIMQERLLRIGRWLSVNGEAIYGTRPWRSYFQWSEGKRDYKTQKDDEPLLLKQTVNPEPGYAVKQLFFTFKHHTLYGILPKYPGNGSVVINNIYLKPGTKISLLGNDASLSWSNDDGNVVVNLPSFDPDSMEAMDAYVLKISSVPDFVSQPVISTQYDSFTSDPLVTISSSGSAVHYTTDGTMPTAASPEYQQPFKLPGNATVRAVAIQKDMLNSSIVISNVVKHNWMESEKIKNPMKGIRYRYYEPGQPSLSSIEEEKPVKEGVATVISLAEKGREDKFCFDFEGYIHIKKSAVYTLYVDSDDGSDLWIDGVQVVNNDGDHNGAEKEEKAALRKGFHKIRVRYYDSGGDNKLKVSLQREGGKKAEVAASILYHK